MSTQIWIFSLVTGWVGPACYSGSLCRNKVEIKSSSDYSKRDYIHR